MLELVIGFSGSGKSAYIGEKMAALATAGQQPVFLIVPEQASFENERALLSRLGAADAARVMVYSFTRLAEAVFREVGGLAGQRLDEGTRALLFSRAVEQVVATRQDLGEPAGHATVRKGAQAAYVKQLLTLWEELRQNGVATEELEQVATRLQQEDMDGTALLQEKARELHQIFTAYEGYAADTGLDELDELTRLAQKLLSSHLLEGAAVFVDGFKGFTRQELDVLERVMLQADSLTVTLPTDTPGRAWPGIDPAACRREFPLFSPVTNTVACLRRLAADHGRQWTLTHLTENTRTHSPALQALERQLYAPAPTAYDGPADEVTVTACGNIYEECAYVAREVRRLLREEGYRCRDITVVARNLENYQGILDDALTQQGLPCYMDTRRDMLCEPLVVYARAALRVAVGGYDTEEILRLLKTDLGPLAPTQTAELENYIYMWGVDGPAWEQDFTDNPAGLDARSTPHTQRQLAQLNGWRQQVIEPLRALRSALRGQVTGREFAEAMYHYLAADDRIAARMAAHCARLEQLSETVLADHAGRLWDQLMAILDRFATALLHQRMAASRLEELFAMLCQLIDLGGIPQGLDAVTVGAAHRIRYHGPRAVFIVGANEGVFPAYPAVDGVFTEAQRQILREQGLALSGDTLTQCVEERFYAYTAVTAPTQRLCISYLEGGDSVPSPLVAAVQTILPHHTKGSPQREDGTDLESAEEMFRRLTAGYSHPGPVEATLSQVLGTRPAYAGRLAAVARGAEKAPFRLENPAVAEQLFGRDMCLSASRTNTFYQCHFSYFCQYGLQLKPRQRARLDMGVVGTLVHHVMETLLPRYTAPGNLVEQLRTRPPHRLTAAEENSLQVDLLATVSTQVTRVAEDYVDTALGGMAGKSGRFRYQLGLACRTAANMLWHTLMDLRQSEFNPADFELSIHPDSEDGDGLLSVKLPHAAGGSVQVRGKVDRVDIYIRKDGTGYARVIDYKTNQTTFGLSKLMEGLNMQMLIYLFVLCDNVGHYPAVQGSLQPAGVLYQPLSQLVIKKGEEGKKQLSKMKMDGIVLADAGVVQAMEYGGEQVYIPAKLKEDGDIAGEVVTPAQFKLLRRVVDSLLCNMAEQLLAGDIEALPTVCDYSPCTYCDYKAVCCHEEGDAEKTVEKRSTKVMLKYLEETQQEVTDSE